METMRALQEIIIAIRKLKQDMHAKNSDQVRIDCWLPDRSLISIHMANPRFEAVIQRLGRITAVHSPAWEDERPERIEECFIGSAELASGGKITGWTTPAYLDLMLGRFQ